MNEIKLGDKVRVSKDAPSEIIKNEGIPTAREFTATTLGGYYAEIKLKGALLPTYFCIPTKYLIKVDAEPTAPKIKIGDRVRKGCLRGIVKEVTPGNVIVDLVDSDGKSLNIGLFDVWMIDSVESVEPTEQTEVEEDARIRQMETELDEFRKAELDKVLHPEKPIFEVTIDNVTMNWQRYTADLAKEVALKVANKYNDPDRTAEYAVHVAKAVVEGLKNK